MGCCSEFGIDTDGFGAGGIPGRQGDNGCGRNWIWRDGDPCDRFSGRYVGGMEKDQTAAAAGVSDQRGYILFHAAWDDDSVLRRTILWNGCDGTDGGVWKYFADFRRIFQG